jgi:predicted PhzF superfamily epimerase YddE/YHI9
MQALASTGAAVATLGITWVAKGVLDRASADKKVCQEALEEIGRGPDISSKKSKKKR